MKLKRINIIYGGENYSVADRELVDLQDEIARAFVNDKPTWMQVNQGEGAPREAYILLTAGTPVTLMPIRLPPGD